jgi:adenylate cyclase
MRGLYAANDLGDIRIFTGMLAVARAGIAMERLGGMAHSVERKLTTILCADVHGYSRLMEQDEAATLATLRGYRDAIDGLIARHRGRIASTAGDSLLADFPSVVEAVQCAIEIQQELAGRNRSLPDGRRMAFRIGINLGDVMLHDGDLFGEGVNVAARLEALAEPGGICISRMVYDQVRNKLSVGFDDLGDQAVKNISEPVQAFQVRLDGAAKDRRRPDRPSARTDTDPAEPERTRQLRTLRRRAVRGGLLIALLFVINLLTSAGNWWFVWPAVFIAGHVVWGALNLYLPDLAGKDQHH